VLGGVWGMPVYFNGTLYYGARGWRCDEGFQDY